MAVPTLGLCAATMPTAGIAVVSEYAHHKSAPGKTNVSQPPGEHRASFARPTSPQQGHRSRAINDQVPVLHLVIEITKNWENPTSRESARRGHP